MRDKHDWPWPADPNIGLVLGGIDAANMPEGALFIIGTSVKDREEQRIHELEMEVERLNDYWLCPEGLTFQQFRDGRACWVCSVGVDHGEGIAEMATEAEANR